MAKKNIGIGQTVYALAREANATLTPRKVTKTGRKWFEVEGIYRTRFDVETGKQEASGYGYGFDHTVYFSEADYNESVRQMYIRREASYYMSTQGGKLPIEDLEKIIEIFKHNGYTQP